jgi:hypothetical protein
MDTSRWPNWAVVLAVGAGLLLYLRSPIDLLPDRMGLIGLLDDVIVLGVALFWLQRRLQASPTPAPASDPGFAEAIPSDPYELLDITYGATADEITARVPDAAQALSPGSRRRPRRRSTAAGPRAYHRDPTCLRGIARALRQLASAPPWAAPR